MAARHEPGDPDALRAERIRAILADEDDDLDALEHFIAGLMWLRTSSRADGRTEWWRCGFSSAAKRTFASSDASSGSTRSNTCSG